MVSQIIEMSLKPTNQLRWKVSLPYQMVGRKHQAPRPGIRFVTGAECRVLFYQQLIIY